MLYSPYLLSREGRKLLSGAGSFPDVFPSLHQYIATLEAFQAVKGSSPWLGLIRTHFNEKECAGLITVLESLAEIERDESVIMQSRFTGSNGKHESNRNGCLMHHVQELRREVHRYASYLGERFPIDL